MLGGEWGRAVETSPRERLSEILTFNMVQPLIVLTIVIETCHQGCWHRSSISLRARLQQCSIGGSAIKIHDNGYGNGRTSSARRARGSRRLSSGAGWRPER